jgi:hypothetical protein
MDDNALTEHPAMNASLAKMLFDMLGINAATVTDGVQVVMGANEKFDRMLAALERIDNRLTNLEKNFPSDVKDAPNGRELIAVG